MPDGSGSMILEIERKFLVSDDSWRLQADEGKIILQAYIAAQNGNTVRVRIMGNGTAEIGIKIPVSRLTRQEYEYPVPISDARHMMDACTGQVIEKVRHIVIHEGYIWEIDVFGGVLTGLVTAEVELESASDEPPLPEWIDREVSGEKAYSNQSLALNGLPPSEQNRG